ncbi:MAG: 2-C-methyl-D-erythritol 4-phosphate cytidylyltransferase [Deltaproteobacteria bacterium]|nr:MAG: 2-C-methyl-D-erythritol 4-phosphate cytidylyltransferase [Deltaproteobacteria bacterium]
MRVVAIIPAAGVGRRMGGAVEKQFLCLGGVPIVAHTLGVFQRSPLVDGVVLVVASHQRSHLTEKVLEPYSSEKLIAVVDGGRERQDSVAFGLGAVPPECELVVVHDGARPLLSHELLVSVLEAAQVHGAALAATPAGDTVKRTKDGLVTETLERDTIWLAQTPQAFHAGLIRKAYKEAVKAQITSTDDAALVERLGVAIHVVPGSSENIKVTTPADLIVAEALLAVRTTSSESGGR